MAADPVVVSHYSDALCVWAYVAQVRFDELGSTFEHEVQIDYRYCSAFGAVHQKMHSGWAERGGVAGYAAHVQGIVDKFEHVHLHADTWARVTPTSSMPAHVFLRAVALVDPSAHREAAWAVRLAFFAQGRDISQRDELLAIAEQGNVSRVEVERRLNDGSAYASLSLDLRTAAEQGITVSPTAVFNEGRQRLTGNVGYRVLEANVAELLRQPAAEVSWC